MQHNDQEPDWGAHDEKEDSDIVCNLTGTQRKSQCMSHVTASALAEMPPARPIDLFIGGLAYSASCSARSTSQCKEHLTVQGVPRRARSTSQSKRSARSNSQCEERRAG
eukprot:scaffold48104_cov38-Tisochrysis_lutea.AAC.3